MKVRLRMLVTNSSLKRLNVLKNIYGAADTYEGEFENIFSKNPDWLIIRKDTFDNTGYFSKKIKQQITSSFQSPSPKQLPHQILQSNIQMSVSVNTLTALSSGRSHRDLSQPTTLAFKYHIIEESTTVGAT